MSDANRTWRRFFTCLFYRPWESPANHLRQSPLHFWMGPHILWSSTGRTSGRSLPGPWCTSLLRPRFRFV